MKWNRKLIAGALVGCLLVFASGRVAQATIVGPGGAGLSSVIPLTAAQKPVAFGGTGMDVLASIIGVAWGPSSGGTSGTYSSWVVDDVGGFKTFVVLVTNAAFSASSLSVTTNASYTGFITDIGHDASNGGTAPPFVQRSSGLLQAVGWNFLGSNIPVGGKSAFLVVKTNSLKYTLGTIGIIDGGTVTVPGYAPLPGTPTAAPLPATAAVGFVLLGGLRAAKKGRSLFGRKKALEA